mmetsp:Transcript_12575/g.42514  ORF Transcript_12575/g.42514 Transcript_12575/m.42514 type:complete len:290 (-) Transcript_12575:332-1201(-)
MLTSGWDSAKPESFSASSPEGPVTASTFLASPAACSSAESSRWTPSGSSWGGGNGRSSATASASAESSAAVGRCGRAPTQRRVHTFLSRPRLPMRRFCPWNAASASRSSTRWCRSTPMAAVTSEAEGADAPGAEERPTASTRRCTPAGSTALRRRTPSTSRCRSGCSALSSGSSNGVRRSARAPEASSSPLDAERLEPTVEASTSCLSLRNLSAAPSLALAARPSAPSSAPFSSAAVAAATSSSNTSGRFRLPPTSTPRTAPGRERRSSSRRRSSNTNEKTCSPESHMR